MAVKNFTLAKDFLSVRTARGAVNEEQHPTGEAYARLAGPADVL